MKITCGQRIPSRIVFCNLGVPVGPFALQFAKALANEGMVIDFFWDISHPVPADIFAYETVQNCNIIFLDTKSPSDDERGAVAYISRAVDLVSNHLAGVDAILVGIEKIGLSVASHVARRLKLPCCYWSLELYDRESLWFRKNLCGEFWLKQEAAACKRVKAVIIQDEDRALAFRGITGFGGKFVYFPVAIDKDNIRMRGGFFLHDFCGIHERRKILLCYGHNRMPRPMIEALEHSIPEPWTLVLHSYQMIGLDGMSNTEKLVISSSRVPEANIPELIASASAGLVHYNPVNHNNKLTAFSSEKIARYLNAGLPIITFGVENIQKLFDEFSCGVMYSQPGQLAAVLRMIEKNERSFAEQAVRAAAKYYLLENVVEEVARFFLNECEVDALSLRERR